MVKQCLFCNWAFDDNNGVVIKCPKCGKMQKIIVGDHSASTNTESLAIALLNKLSDRVYYADSNEAASELIGEILDEWHSATANIS